jgi:hypothetical protein
MIPLPLQLQAISSPPAWGLTLQALSPPEEERLAWRAWISNPYQRVRLEGALEGRTMELIQALQAISSPTLERVRIEGRLERWPSPHACLLRALLVCGQTGEKLALHWRGLAPEEQWRMDGGIAETSIPFKYLAYALWKDRLCRPPALDLRFLEELASRPSSIPSPSSSPPPALPSDIVMGITSLVSHKNSILLARLTVWIASRCQDRRAGQSIIIRGGYSALFLQLLSLSGASSSPSGRFTREGAGQLRALLQALQGGGLLRFTYAPPAPLQRGRLEIWPGDVWRSDRQKGKRHRALTPLLWPTLEGIGRPNDRGAIAWLFLLILCELRKQSKQLLQGGGALITLELASSLLQRAGGPEGKRARERLALQALSCWAAGGELERVGPDRWHVGKGWPEVREFLEESGGLVWKGPGAGTR